MAFVTKNSITGAVVLSIVAPLTSIGGYNETEIDNDISTNGDQSIRSIGYDYFLSVASSCNVDLETLGAAETAYAISALYWYLAGKYLEKDLLINPRKSGEDCDECRPDPVEWFDNACKLLKLVNTCLCTSSDYCENPLEIPSVFGAKRYKDPNCK